MGRTKILIGPRLPNILLTLPPLPLCAPPLLPPCLPLSRGGGAGGVGSNCTSTHLQDPASCCLACCCSAARRARGKKRRRRRIRIGILAVGRARRVRGGLDCRHRRRRRGPGLSVRLLLLLPASLPPRWSLRLYREGRRRKPTEWRGVSRHGSHPQGSLVF